MTKFASRALRAAAVCVLLGSTAACATVTRGTNQSWTVETDPAGASVKTNIGFACEQTPCTFKMPRKSEFDVTVSKPGYKTYTGHVTHAVAGAGAAGMAGNVLVGGVIGVGVDAVSGATFDLKPNPLKISLEKDDGSAVAAAQPAAAAAPATASAPATPGGN